MRDRTNKTAEEFANRNLFKNLQPFGEYPPEDPRHISGIFPTSAELAEQLARNGHERFIEIRLPKGRPKP